MMKGWFILGILYRVEPLVGPPVGTDSTTQPAPQDSGTCSAALNRMCLSYTFSHTGRPCNNFVGNSIGNRLSGRSWTNECGRYA